MTSSEIVRRIVNLPEVALLDSLQLISQIWGTLISQKSLSEPVRLDLLRIQLRISRYLLDGDFNLSREERAEVANVALRTSRSLISVGSATLILDHSERPNFQA